MAESIDPTVPLDDIFKQTVTYHGREYQQYAIENNVYFSPIDEDEAERLQIANEALKKIFDNRLVFPPVRRLRNVLDCGFGTGAWALEVAAQYPRCEVCSLAIFFSFFFDFFQTPKRLARSGGRAAKQPGQASVATNDKRVAKHPFVCFTFDTGEFDLVHSQMVAGGIDAGRWRTYLKDIHRVLRPGGWCQIVEIYYQAQSDNGSLTDEHGLRYWSKLYLQSLSQYKDPRAPIRMETLVRNAGFTDVETRIRV
ncbi:UMTA methyltransferase [Niveomyces insectorum RCEF 264]|uniref:UMTA methyltransferase n=1 Tax=Niveomyces insectorum RCEF 264 TaxID=1081102 RepID=A0A167SER6_9HYPO|nr:UMTA methyltransferase [Niveomyces insectorum RCEF 264]